MRKRGRKKKKFYPEFKPQYVEVIVFDHQDKINKRVMITKVNYITDRIQVIGEI